jgi:RNA polymerase sigma factor (sigma-70 family)
MRQRLDAAKERLILEHLPLVERMVGRRVRRMRPDHLEDARAAATLGLVEAVARFRPEEGDFVTLASIRIHGAITDWQRANRLIPIRRSHRGIAAFDSLDDMIWEPADPSTPEREVEVAHRLRSCSQRVREWVLGRMIGMSRQEMAERAGLSRTRVSQIAADAKRVFAAAAVLVVALSVGCGGYKSTEERAAGLGQKHFLVSGHVRRQPSWQLTWIAPDAATGYTVYIGSVCPGPQPPPADAGAADAGAADAGAAAVLCPGEVALCTLLHTTTNYNVDAGTCACNGDGGLTRGCIFSTIGTAAIAAGACSNASLCCVAYPGTPAPAGKKDGLVVSQCYSSLTADGGPIQTDGGRCCAHGSCWYPYPNYPLDGGGVGNPDGQAAYSGTCWQSLYIERGYGFDVETKH